MNHQALRYRIMAALKLAPMTVSQLAKCLSAHVSGVRQALDELYSTCSVIRYRMQTRRRCNGAPPFFYEARS